MDERDIKQSSNDQKNKEMLLYKIKFMIKVIFSLSYENFLRFMCLRDAKMGNHLLTNLKPLFDLEMCIKNIFKVVRFNESSL